MKLGKICAAATAALMLCIGGANAADLYAGKAEPAAVEHDCCAQANWRGLYLGVGVGIGATLNEIKLSAPGATATLDSFAGDGIFGTVQAGFDFNLAHRVVAGIFADYDFGSQEATVSANALGFNGNLVKLEKKNAWSIGGRLGLVAGNTLWYVPLGYTRADVDLSIPAAVVGGNGYTKNNSHSGFFIGAGAETKLTDRLGLKLEYRFIQYEDQCLFCQAGVVDIKNDPREHSARLVLTYKFDFDHHRAAEPMK